MRRNGKLLLAHRDVRFVYGKAVSAGCAGRKVIRLYPERFWLRVASSGAPVRPLISLAGFARDWRRPCEN
jgi:hypothetical protein